MDKKTNNQRRTTKRTAKRAPVIKENKPKLPSLSITYKDIDDSVKKIVQEIDGYRGALQYKENFEDAVAMMLEDGGVWVDGKYVIPVHRILRFDAIPYKKPTVKPTPKKPTPEKPTPEKPTPEKKDSKEPERLVEKLICKDCKNPTPTLYDGRCSICIAKVYTLPSGRTTGRENNTDNTDID